MRCCFLERSWKHVCISYVWSASETGLTCNNNNNNNKKDTTAPELSDPNNDGQCYPDITPEATSSGLTSVGTAEGFSVPAATDIADDNVSVSCDYTPDDDFTLNAATEVTCTATDDAGETDTCNFFVTVTGTYMYKIKIRCSK